MSHLLHTDRSLLWGKEVVGGVGQRPYRCRDSVLLLSRGLLSDLLSRLLSWNARGAAGRLPCQPVPSGNQ